jgi:1,4-dihydroxy-2-naphthoate octaprenyltransferase
VKWCPVLEDNLLWQENDMSDMRSLLGPMRIPFLALTPACVLLGFGSAVWTSGRVSAFHLALAFVGALAAHVSVNALNEYSDFRSGLDFKTIRTPFSGGSGSLPEKPEKAPLALITGLTAFAVVCAVGAYFVWVAGLFLLPLGLLGLIIVFSYTDWIVRNPFLTLIAPGLGFGPLMVMGTDFVLTGGYSWTAVFSSLIPFFLVSDLLLLNQFPDVDADRSVGRRTFPIVAGRKNGAILYGIFLVLTYVSIIAGVYFRFLPRTSLLGLASLVIAVPACRGVIRYADNVTKLMPYLGLNTIIVLMTQVLVAVGLLVG